MVRLTAAVAVHGVYLQEKQKKLLETATQTCTTNTASKELYEDILTTACRPFTHPVLVDLGELFGLHGHLFCDVTTGKHGLQRAPHHLNLQPLGV